jgi:hypothetical protein
MTAERLDRFAQAWARCDLDELRDYLTEDVVYSPLTGEVVRGREAVIRRFAEVLAADQGCETVSRRRSWPGRAHTIEIAAPRGQLSGVLTALIGRFRAGGTGSIHASGQSAASGPLESALAAISRRCRSTSSAQRANSLKSTPSA